MLKVVPESNESDDAAPAGGRSLLNKIVRDGTRQILAAMLRAEFPAYVEVFADEVDQTSRRLVVHEPRVVTTAASAVQVNDRRTNPVTGEHRRFASAILQAWARKSPRVAEVLPLRTCTVSPATASLPLWSSSLAQRRSSLWQRSPG